MDERKRNSKLNLKKVAIPLFVLSLCFFSYGVYVFFQTKNIVHPKKCFTTQMFKVKLCPNLPNYVHYKEVPKHFYHSLILSEDAAFYSHKGFDWFEIKESFRRNIVEWKFARGGSTLTQQLAKNLYLTPQKSLDRKFKEFFIAKQIEEKLSKFQILEKYVNVVEFGKNIYGIRSASEHYFNKEPALLNVLESVYLVSLLPSPKRLGKSFNDKILSKENQWRMLIIIKRLYRTGKIPDAVYVYLKMLIESEDWPFFHYSEEFLDEKGLSIEDQMLLEFDDSVEDKNFLNGESTETTPPDESFLEETSEELEIDTTEPNLQNSSELRPSEENGTEGSSTEIDQPLSTDDESLTESDSSLKEAQEETLSPETEKTPSEDEENLETEESFEEE